MIDNDYRIIHDRIIFDNILYRRVGGSQPTQWTERVLSEAVVVMRADEIHPMRFVRQLPKEAWPFIRHAARDFSQGLMTGDEFQSVVDFTANVYNRALEKIAFEQRPETSDILVSLSSTIASNGKIRHIADLQRVVFVVG